MSPRWSRSAGFLFNPNYVGHIILVQFPIPRTDSGWTIRRRRPGSRRCGDGRSLRTSVRVTVWVLERTKLLRPDRPKYARRKSEKDAGTTILLRRSMPPTRERQVSHGRCLCMTWGRPARAGPRHKWIRRSGSLRVTGARLGGKSPFDWGTAQTDRKGMTEVHIHQAVVFGRASSCVTDKRPSTKESQSVVST